MKSRSMQLGLALAAAGLCTQPLTALAAQGDWIVRGGVGVVDPKSDNLDLGGGLGLDVDTGTSFTIEGAYFLTDHWALELLASYPFSHDVDLDGAEGSGGTIADVKHLPPTLSLQYHFNPEGRFRPYLGAGVNYTYFFSEDTVGGTLASLGLSDPQLDDSWGLAAQAGIDIGITGNWFANFGVRWIDIDSDLSAVTGNGDRVDLGEVEIDPFVYQAQIGYRFGRPAPVAAAVAAPVVAAAVAAPAAAPADADGDGVLDGTDQCPDTPQGERVGPFGCTCDVTRQLQFGFDSAELTAADQTALDEVAANLTRLKFVEGTITGHTDSTGDEGYNQGLSERRAASAAAYLEGKGIAVGRLKALGAGETQPIADNGTAEGRALNRRVVLRRTDCDAPR